MSQGIRHLSALPGDDPDATIKRRAAFESAHPEVTIAFHGPYYSASWPEGGEGKPRREIRHGLSALLDALDPLFEDVIIPPSVAAGSSQVSGSQEETE